MSSPVKDYDITYKVLVVGEMSVGKTSLIRRYSRPEEKMAMSYLTTVGNYKTPYTIILVDQYYIL
jgi:GTPase SAR1 family protein